MDEFQAIVKNSKMAEHLTALYHVGRNSSHITFTFPKTSFVFKNDF